MRRRALIFREHNLRSRMMRRVWRTCGGSPARRFFAGEMRKRFAVDRTALDNSFGFNEDQESESISPVKKEPLTALGKDLQSYIKLKGPITLHDYMAQSLNHMIHGYYQSKHEVIGEQGDFITAPEVSQLFGEMLGIWCMSMWEQMGRPAKINLVELGPGKGTLMKDILRVAAKFGSFRNAVSVHLVELSLSLRVQQYEALDCTGGRGVNAGSSAAGATGVSIKDKQCYRTERDIPVHWNSFLYQVPDDVPSLIIGNVQIQRACVACSLCLIVVLCIYCVCVGRRAGVPGRVPSPPVHIHGAGMAGEAGRCQQWPFQCEQQACCAHW